MNVKCISDVGRESSLTIGKVYKVLGTYGDIFELVDDKGNRSTYNEVRFEEVKEETSMVGKKVRCVDDIGQYSINSHKLVKGQIYTIKAEKHDYTPNRILLEETGDCVFRMERFVLVEESVPRSPSVPAASNPKQAHDPEEMRMRAALFATTSDNVCRKCSGPLPCQYHG
jgi:hypothetical protein